MRRCGRLGPFAKSARTALENRRPKADSDESPLYEIDPEGWDTWQTDPPLAPTLGAWLAMIADAIESGDHDRVYDTMWLGPTNPDEFPLI